MAAKKQKKKQKRIPALEWLAAATGLVLLVGILGYLLIDGVRTNAAMPPVLSIAPVRLVGDGRSYVLEVDVANRSRQTASAVQIEGTLTKAASPEKSSATLSYVPGQSIRRAGLVFDTDPRGQGLQLRVTGYEKP